MNTLINLIGLILPLFGFVIFKEKNKRIILILWFLSFLFLLLAKFDLIRHNILIYLLIMSFNSYLIIKYVFNEDMKKYKILAVIFILFVLTIIRDAFHYPFFYEFLTIQVIVSLPILIYTLIKSYRRKSYFILCIIFLFVLNELIRNSSLIGIS